MKQKFLCDDCGAFGSVNIANKDDDYEVLVCPSCGTFLDNSSDVEDYDE